MTESFPALRAFLAARGLLPRAYPHPRQTLLGSALAALLAWLLIGMFYAAWLAVSNTWELAQEAGSAVIQTFPPEEKQAKPPVRLATPPTLPPDARKQVRERLNPAALPYRENRQAPIGDVADQIDYALRQTFIGQNLNDERCIYLGGELRQQGEKRFLFQRFKIYLPLLEKENAVENFQKELKSTLEVWSQRASLSQPQPGRLDIAVDGVATHRLWLETVGEDFLLPPTETGPRLTIIMDDMGGNQEALQQILLLDIPVTVSIWPRSGHAQEIAEAVHASGREILVHQPMEPMDKSLDMGSGGITLAMSSRERRAIVSENIGLVPHASGINNHMGSRLTRDRAACDDVCAAAAEAGLFVLDSLTHGKSQLYQAAQAKHLPAYRRTLFLDDDGRSERGILARLREGEAIARRQGQAVLIGHPYPKTLAALRQWAGERDLSISVVPLRHLPFPTQTLFPENSEDQQQ